jgi:hypothetical protein
MDLAFFLLIFLVFMLSYGVAKHALLHPNSEPNWLLLRNVIYEPYWNVYGELFLEELQGM